MDRASRPLHQHQLGQGCTAVAVAVAARRSEECVVVECNWGFRNGGWHEVAERDAGGRGGAAC